MFANDRTKEEHPLGAISGQKFEQETSKIRSMSVRHFVSAFETLHSPISPAKRDILIIMEPLTPNGRKLCIMRVCNRETVNEIKDIRTRPTEVICILEQASCHLWFSCMQI
jgi:hypothetical protein